MRSPPGALRRGQNWSSGKCSPASYTAAHRRSSPTQPSATKSRPAASWLTQCNRAAPSSIRALTLRRARSSRDASAIAPNSPAVHMESSSRPRRRSCSTAKSSRKFSFVFPASPSELKASASAVAGVTMIVSSAKSAAKRSAWDSPIHSSCSIGSPRRDSTSGLTSL